MSIEEDKASVSLITGADLDEAAPGGIRTYVVGLARFLVSRGISVRILSNGPTAGLPAECDVVQICASHIPTSLGFQHALKRWTSRNQLSMTGLLHFQRPDDLFWVHRSAPTPRAVCTLHGDPWRGVRRRRGWGWAQAYRFAETRAIGRFKRIIAVDPRTASAYSSRYPMIADRISVIPTAVTDIEREGCEKRRLSVESSEPTFLFAGRFSVEKRLDRILAAASSLPYARTRVLIAGSGPEIPEIPKADGKVVVSLLGRIRHEQMADVYRSADALVIASEFEGLPTVALEALAAGRPVVALRGCGLDDVLTPNLGVLADDLDDLPRAMMGVLRLKQRDPEIAVPEEYTWPKVGSSILRVYAKVAPEFTQTAG